MSWTVLIVLVIALGVALCALLLRRRELARMSQSLAERERSTRDGAAGALLRHPVIDLSRCLGCGTCVAVCPEGGVLDVVHGQAVVINGARCQGISACERECPVGAVTVTLANVEERRDIPVLTSELEAVGTPGLFLAGEVTAHALIKNAIDQGTAVAAEIARRTALAPQAAAPAPRAAAVPDEAFAASGARRDGGAPSALLETEEWSAESSASASARSSASELLRSGSFGASAPRSNSSDDEVVDVCVVGAGPAGLACALEAQRLGLSLVVLEQESEIGGTVAKYPRRKLVMTQPVDVPQLGRLKKTSYSKEELIDLWQELVTRYELPLQYNEVFQGVERDSRGIFEVRTSAHIWRARHVCLAMGRRGTPNKLGIPGEELPKVAYSLLDAQSFQGRRILVVGGGDSAIETALGLAEQSGNQVTLSYRRESFFRVRTRNSERLQSAVAAGRMRVLLQSQPVAIRADHVEIDVADPQGAQGPKRYALPNDDVFVMAGGTPPVPILERSGVSFDPALREKPQPLVEQGTGLVPALTVGFVLAFAALVWAVLNVDYYALPAEVRPVHENHAWLRPGLGLGLAFGIVGALMIVANLLYLVRRTPSLKFQRGSLQAWMTSHVATGIFALLCATLHSGMAPRDTVGGHALWALVVLLVSGVIGRYFYAYVPRAANGRELELAEVKAQLARISDAWDPAQRAFVTRVREAVDHSVHAAQWNGSFLGRLRALVLGQRALRTTLMRLELEGRNAGISREQVRETLALARDAHRMSVAAAHLEDLRALLNTWRYVHRWVAALMVALIVLHIAYALSYGAHFFDGGSP